MSLLIRRVAQRDRACARIGPSAVGAWLVLALAGLACFVSVVREAQSYAGASVFGYNPLLLDWAHNTSAVQRVLAGAPLYAAAQLHGPYPDHVPVMIGFLYPPPAALLLAPFVWYPIGLIAWIVLNVGLLVTGFVAILHKELGRFSAVGLAFVLLGLTVQTAFTEGVAVGNMNVGLAGLLAWTWALGSSDHRIGFLAGIAGTVKLVPAVLAFWGVRARGWRAFAEALATGVVLSLVALPLTGLGAWFDFFRAEPAAQAVCANWIPALACVFQPALGDAGAKIVVLAVTLLLCLLAIRLRNDYLAFACIVAAWLAPVPDLHTHYFLVVYVLLVVGLARTAGRAVRTRRDAARPAHQPALP